MAKKPHHHGNLRAALIQAGLEILDDSGLAGLTLRGVAARAGVSHAAPAHHFEGLPGLTAALAARGWAIFTETMLQERATAPDQPRARLLAIADGYLRFAFTHPGLFALIFNTDTSGHRTAEVLEQSGRAYAVLEEACAPFVGPSDTGQSTEIMIWSLVHGLAVLQKTGHVGPPDLAVAQAVFAAILPPLQLK